MAGHKYRFHREPENLERGMESFNLLSKAGLSAKYKECGKNG